MLAAVPKWMHLKTPLYFYTYPDHNSPKLSDNKLIVLKDRFAAKNSLLPLVIKKVKNTVNCVADQEVAANNQIVPNQKTIMHHTHNIAENKG